MVANSTSISTHLSQTLNHFQVNSERTKHRSEAAILVVGVGAGGIHGAHKQTGRRAARLCDRRAFAAGGGCFQCESCVREAQRGVPQGGAREIGVVV